ncbi:hypothetical protein Glove_59g105 [Diversispora epigaea]|uniref:Uncharacterized protein n=1 Tax=Diversispora epigaea TaxID=1348612 RepID=A0A397JGA1_9GLOM|nr:hypothetical protein Glove_59g105 [Diversispora epigaea]
MPLSLLDIIKKLNTENLIEFLRNQELNLDEDDFSLLKKQKISGSNFLLLSRKDLIRCQLKVDPTVTLLNLITEINTGKLSNEKLIPVLQDIKNSKWLYSRYFYTFSYNEWSLKHYENWILNNYAKSKKEVYNQCFYKIIRKIKEDPKTLGEIREIISKLDRKQYVSDHPYSYRKFIPKWSNSVDSDSIDNKYFGYKAILEGNVSPFANTILNYYKTKSLREFRDYNEVAFQTAIELLLPTKHRHSEVRLVIDGSKKSGAGRFGFIDVFVDGLNENGTKTSVILELKCISLVGLLSREEGRWIDNANYKSLVALDAKLEMETEDELFNRKYCYWCKEKKKCEQINVKKIINDGVDQLNRYKLTMQKSKVDNHKGSGVYDDKIEVEKGEGYLGGILLVSIGSKRILTKLSKFKKTDINFSISC